MDCVEELDFHCLKLRSVSNLYTLLKRKSFAMVDGLNVEYSGNTKTTEEATRALVDQQWGSLLFNYIPRMIRDMSLKLNMYNGGNFVVSRSRKDNGFIDMSFEAANEIGEGRKFHIADYFNYIFNTQNAIKSSLNALKI